MKFIQPTLRVAFRSAMLGIAAGAMLLSSGLMPNSVQAQGYFVPGQQPAARPAQAPAQRPTQARPAPAAAPQDADGEAPIQIPMPPIPEPISVPARSAFASLMISFESASAIFDAAMAN